MASLDKIAQTLRSEAVAGMKPKELMAAVRAKHPDASKKDVVRAAFYAIIENQGQDAERLSGLHDFAIGERAFEEDAPVKSKKLRKKKRKATAAEAASPAVTN